MGTNNNTFLQKISLVAISGLIISFTSCVPMRKFEDLQASKLASDSANKSCLEMYAKLREQDSALDAQVGSTKRIIQKLKEDSLETAAIVAKQKELYKVLNETYEKEIKFGSLETQRKMEQLKELEAKYNERAKEYEEMKAKMTQLKDEEKKLQSEKGTLATSLQERDKSLQEKEAKLAELQQILHSKDSAVKALKTSVSNALLGFKDAGLEINIKNGKVYVSLSEQLLFASGKTDVDKKGREALLQLATVLEKQRDINILVEGHTDDVPMKSEKMQDNWDLSVMRANSIVRILTKDGSIDPKRIMAAGRGQYMPIDPAKTPEARRKNRRTEIILTPKLDELLQIIDNQ
ncbi:MAG: OmpA family protein [Bacteroidota bacterium]|nr:OmpA family protein [Bacteroidota bacterium]